MSRDSARRTLVLSPDRVAAIKKALDENAIAINGEDVLRIEIDCGADEFTLKVQKFSKYAHRSPSYEDTLPRSFHP